MKRFVVLFFLLSMALPVLAQESKENADFKLALNLYNDKMYDLAVEQFQAFINLYPNTQQSADAKFYLGLTQSKLGKHEDARMTFQNFAISYTDHPRAAEAWMNVAEEYAAMDDIHDAAMAFERVKTFQPKSTFAPQALLRAEACYEQRNDRSDALRVLRTLTQEYTTPEVLPARIKYSELLFANGQYEQALQESKRVIDVSNDPSMKARAEVLTAKALIALGKSSEAEAPVADVIKNYKTTLSYDDALFTSGVLKNSAGNTDDAMKAWKILADDSAKAPAHLRQDALMEMAEANNRVRLFPRALLLFERAAALGSTRNGEAFYRAAVAAERIGDLNKAAQYYAKAASDSAGTIDRRAILIGAFKAAAITKNFAEAVRLAQAYQQQFPDDKLLPRVLYESAAIALNELSDAKTAMTQCEFLIERFPDSEYADDAMFTLGLAKKKNGDVDGALAALEGLLKKYPSSEYAGEAQKQIRLAKAFDLRSRDEGVQKLALLIGDVIAQKSKGDLAYRLAEIYFTDLKDYELAAEQYRYALSVDLNEHLRPAAWFNAGQSYELLALKEGTKTERGKDFSLNAVAMYDSLMAQYPAGAMSDQAAVAAFTLRLQHAGSVEAVRALGTNFLSKTSSARGRDIALLALGDSYFQSKNYSDALLAYKLLVEKYSGRETVPAAQYRLAMSLDGMMERDSAAKVLISYFASYPNHAYSASAALYLAQWYADSGRVADALNYFDAAEKRYPYALKNVDLENRKANAYYHAGDNVHAIEWYQKALEKLRQDYFTVSGNSGAEREIIFRLANSYEKIGDRANAKQWYAEYILRDQASAQAGTVYYTLASFAKAENNVELAAKYLQEANCIASASGGKVASLALETAELLFSGEKYSEALPRYNEALQQTNSDTTIRYIQSRMVICYYRLDNMKEADKRTTEFNKKYSDERYKAEFEFERAKYFIRNDDLGRAQKYLQTVIKDYSKSPVVPEALSWVARVCELNQKTDSAVIVYHSILEQYPNDPIIPRVRLNLGNAYYTLEQWDAASQQYRFLLDNEAKAPDLVQFAMSNLIMTYKEMELYDGALELTRKYIERFPDDTDLIEKKIDIGVLYQKLGYYDQSIVHLQHLLEAGDASLEAELRYYIGEAYYDKGEYQHAILEFLKVPYLVTTHAHMDWISTSYYMAGQAYEKMSKYDQALIMYKQIVDRKDTDVQFKTAAQKEIDRVNTVIGKK
ncbi:MAG TPA: tetratricopeptide repeat protein [Bacteroidota bacterium]|nr:tetratricopeptide repeat protein [Bacteroidota bacterium]